MYSLEFDETSGIIHLKQGGFLDIDQARKIIAELVPLVTRVRRETGRMRLLSEPIGQLHASPPETLEAFASVQGDLIAHPHDRAGYVIESALVRLQVARLGNADQVRYFPTVAEARAWLME